MRNTVLRLFPLLMAICAVTSASAEPVHLTAKVINADLPGSVLKLDTPLGTVVPITFGTDGYMTGEAGSLGSLLGSDKDRGRWWVVEDRVCYKWFRWFDAKQYCVSIERDGEKIFWKRDDGETGTATLETHRRPAPVQVAVAVTITKPLPSPKRIEPLKSPVQVATAVAENAPPPVLVAPPKPAIRPAKKQPVAIAAVHAQPAKPPVISTAASDRSRTPTYHIAGIEPDDVLNVRRGPSEDDEIIGSLQSTSRDVALTGRCVEDWCPVRHGQITGWVNSYYLAND